MPSFGDLREQVRFDRRSIVADDGYGNVVNGWATLAGPWPARISPSPGSEEVLAERLKGIEPIEITIRWCAQAADIQAQDRAVNVRSGKTYNVTSIVNADERGGYLTLLATAGSADG